MYEGYQRQMIITDLRSVVLNTVWCKSSVVFISSNICRVSRSLLYCTDCVWRLFSRISKLDKGSCGLCVCPVGTNNIQFGRQPPVQAVNINSLRTAWYDAGVRMLVAHSHGREYGDLSATGWVAVLRLTGGVPPAELVRGKRLFSVIGRVQSRKFSASNFMNICTIVFASGQMLPVSLFIFSRLFAP